MPDWAIGSLKTQNTVGRTTKSKRMGGPSCQAVGKKISIPGDLGLTCPSSPWQDTERFQARSQELEQKLFSKEQELEQLVQKQQRVCFPVSSACLARHSVLSPSSCLLHLPFT